MSPHQRPPMQRRPRLKHSRSSRRIFAPSLSHPTTPPRGQPPQPPSPPSSPPKPLTPVMLYENERFVYDPALRARWHMPQHLWIRIPAPLLAELRAFQAVGAVLLAATERVDALWAERRVRGFPERDVDVFDRGSRPREGTRSAEDGGDVRAEESQAAHGSEPRKDSAVDASATTLLASPEPTKESAQPQLQVLITAPATPTVRSPTPSLLWLDPAALDISVHDSAAPINTFPDEPEPSRATPRTCHEFCEMAWETYLRALRAELDELRAGPVVQLQHLVGVVECTFRDVLHGEGETQPMLRSAAEEFAAWWAEAKRGVQRWVDVVAGFEEPRREDVEAELELELQRERS
ncbi:hypothetical protein B0A49_00974 [Cryomyces minteri]|uniref:Uncharacterized protein n=1 Tax=Cryomyces minteri TaxID=331657 RepID=A0A4U0XQR4_9PEZI|nr:hypothetical protein B0A49_00974 [Cryomyces minteri]